MTKSTEEHTFNDIYDFFEKKGINAYDVLGASKHFYKWCDLTNKGELDPEGKSRGASQIWYREYNDHPQGESSRPQFLNLWHWLMDLTDFLDKRTTTPNEHFLRFEVKPEDVLTYEDEGDNWGFLLLSQYHDFSTGSLKLYLSVDR